jgi:hypothetical protein
MNHIKDFFRIFSAKKEFFKFFNSLKKYMHSLYGNIVNAFYMGFRCLNNQIILKNTVDSCLNSA